MRTGERDVLAEIFLNRGRVMVQRLDGASKGAPKGISWFMCSVLPEPNSGCWLWTGKLRRGYGVACVGMHEQPAHRLSYELFVGKIPDGLVLDHLCRLPCCVNPQHLEPVTIAENVARGMAIENFQKMKHAITQCPKGHIYSGSNLYLSPSGHRDCVTCQRERVRDWRRRERQKKMMQCVEAV